MQPLLEATAVSKRFGAIIALQDVDFAAERGEIHALLGENGAGKTSLMGVIAGRLRPDGGQVRLDGRLLKPGAPARALAAGIATVHQSPLLFEHLSVQDNLALSGAAPRHSRRAWEQAQALAAALGFKLAPAPTLEGLTVGDRVRLEIVRALAADPRLLILDEPTGLLAAGELAEFLDLLRKLRAQGRAVILITHKLAEALAVADRITVLRAGKVVARTRPADTSQSQLARLMVDTEPGPRPAGTAQAGSTVLELHAVGLDVDKRAALSDLSIGLCAGEITGLAGIDGNGQRELVEVLAGRRQPSRGRITIGGTALRAGGDERLAAIPEDRDRDGLILDMELWENLLLAPRLRRELRGRLGRLHRTGALELCRQLIARFQIHASGPRMTAGALSGGHRQRLTVARALAAHPAVLVAHNMTRGLDLGACAEVYQRLAEFTAGGGAVLFISSDLDELLGLCQRLVAIQRGRLTHPGPEEMRPERLALLMAGAGA